MAQGVVGQAYWQHPYFSAAPSFIFSAAKPRREYQMLLNQLDLQKFADITDESIRQRLRQLNKAQDIAATKDLMASRGLFFSGQTIDALRDVARRADLAEAQAQMELARKLAAGELQRTSAALAYQDALEAAASKVLGESVSDVLQILGVK